MHLPIGKTPGDEWSCRKIPVPFRERQCHTDALRKYCLQSETVADHLLLPGQSGRKMIVNKESEEKVKRPAGDN